MENLIGRKFGKLLILEIGAPVIEKDGKSSKRFLCLCDCGAYKEIRCRDIKYGRSESCGCAKWVQSAEKARLATAKRVFIAKYSDGDLSFDDFLVLSQQNCHYCGTQPSNISNEYNKKSKKNASQFAKENGNFIYNGLDRINNSLSHSKQNLVPCCKWCNYAKRERSAEEFIDWVKRIYNHSCK